MKKRLLSMILAISMVLTFLPISAFAASQTFSVGDFDYCILSISGWEGQCCLTQYHGTDSEVSIPAEVEYEGKTYPVKVIGDKAFYNQQNLTSVTIPDSVTWIAASVFSSCKNLKQVKIPGSVTLISGYAFDSCSSLTNITIPASVKSIGIWAFMSSGLEEITFEGTIDTISQGLFYDCKNLKTVRLPEGVTSIDSSAFCDCTALENVYIPSSVQTIGKSAFHSGYHGTPLMPLKDVTYGGTEEQWKALLKKRVADGNCEISLGEDGYFASFDASYSGSSEYAFSLGTVSIDDRITFHYALCTVTFDYGEMANNLQTFKEIPTGTYATAPQKAPSVAGYRLAGWYTDNETFQNEFKFAETPVQKGITLYAKWEEIPDHQLTIKNGTLQKVILDEEDITADITKDADGKFIIPENAEVTVAFDKDAFADSSLKFSYWNIEGLTQDEANKYNKQERFTFTMPAVGVTLEAMTQDDSIDDAVAEALGNTAIVGTAVLGGAALGVTGYMLGTEMYLICLLPIGTPIPTNTAQLAKLVWTDAGKPAPAALLAEDATEEQQAMAWAVENDLIDADKAADASVSRIEVIKTWKKAQSVKKG